jgi:hypothetical protein
MSMQYRVSWSNALYAGVAAGILATGVQIALWSIFADVLPAILSGCTFHRRHRYGPCRVAPARDL